MGRIDVTRVRDPAVRPLLSYTAAKPQPLMEATQEGVIDYEVVAGSWGGDDEVLDFEAVRRGYARAEGSDSEAGAIPWVT